MTTNQTNSPRGGRGWAYACAQLGGAVSIAANWAHSYVAPNGAPIGWTPEFGAVAFSVFWPIAVLFAVEAFARVGWPDGWRYVAIRFGGLLPVAAVAAVVSYLHLSGLLRHYGASPFEANFGPLAIDGLMLIGTGALIGTSAVRRVATQATGANVVAEAVRVEVAPGASFVTEHLPIAVPNTVAEQASAIEANTPAEHPAAIGPNTDTDQPAERGDDGEANVRAIDSAKSKPITDPITVNLRKIKRTHKDWRTNMPSARQCAAVIGVAPSTGLSYRNKLLAELAANPSDKEQTG